MVLINLMDYELKRQSLIYKISKGPTVIDTFKDEIDGVAEALVLHSNCKTQARYVN